MLTDSQIKKAKPQDKAYRLVDTGGLHVFVTPSGGKLWRLRYKVDGTEKTLSLGKCPELSLAQARAARDDAKAVKRGGKDPAVQKKIEKLVGRKSHETTFEAVAREWHDLQKPQWVDRHADDVLQSFRREVFPHIGTLPLSEITSPVVLGVLRLVEVKNAKETARRLRQRISSVFVYAISTGRAVVDPAGPLTKALAPMKKGKQPAIVDLDDAREVLRRVEGTPSHPVTKLAIRLTALTAVRPGTIVSTPWHEFADIEERRVWQIPAERMKLLRKHKDDEARDHIVPLSDQAVETIVALRMLTGKGPWGFPNGRHAHRIMSENAMGYLLNRAGYRRILTLGLMASVLEGCSILSITQTTSLGFDEPPGVSDAFVIAQEVGKGKISGQSLPWANPSTGSAGVIDKVWPIGGDGACRGFSGHYMTLGGEARSDGAACKNGNGMWQVSETGKVPR